MKYAFVKLNETAHAITRLCDALNVSTSGYYDWVKRPLSQQEQERRTLLTHITTIHHEVKQRYGSPRMHLELVDRGHTVSKGRVERIMHTYDIKASRSRRHKRTIAHRGVVAPVENILDRQFRARQPNTKCIVRVRSYISHLNIL